MKRLFVPVVSVLFVIVMAVMFFKLVLTKEEDLPARAAQNSAPVVVYPPRTDQPIAEMTRFFKHDVYRGEDGKGVPLDYYLYEPEKPYPQNLKFPLVLVLHGAPGNAYAAKSLTQSAEMRRAYPAFIVAPVLPRRDTWSFPAQFPEPLPLKDYFIGKKQSLPETVALIRHLSQTLPVDTSRIYVIGCSEGGVGVYGAVRDYADVFAAGVVISGLWTAADVQNLIKLPLVIMHGALETTTPASLARKVADGIRAHGGNVGYIEMPQMDHACPSEVFYGPTTWNWLFSQRKTK